jgi:hypothetical protein
MTPEQRANIGTAARRILESAWDVPNRNSPLVTHALRSVCATFGTDPMASAKLLRRSLEPEHLQKHGFEELPWISRSVPQLARFDPEFVADLYVGTFDWSEADETTTQMGSGRILALQSTKKQDYQQARWQLSQHYPSFVALAPIPAARAMVAAVDAYCRDERAKTKQLHASIFKDHPEWGSDDENDESQPELTFAMGDVVARFVPDFSNIWDSGSVHQGEEAVSLMNTFFRQLDSIASQEGGKGRVNDVLTTIIGLNRRAVVWRRLLRLASTHTLIASSLRNLAWATPLLLAPETSDEAQGFLKILYPSLSAEDKKLLEEHIMNLSSDAAADLKEMNTLARDRLIGAIADFGLINEEAQTLGSQLRDADLAKTATSQAGHTGFTQWQGDDADWWRDVHGVNTKKATNHELLEIESPVKQFAANHSNDFPSLAQAKEILPQLKQLRDLLDHPHGEPADHSLADSASGYLSAACSRIAGIDGLSGSSELAAFVEAELILATGHRLPESKPENEEQFDRSPGWGWPQARIAAAEGLLNLVASLGFAPASVLDALDRLARDATAVVRYHIARHCTVLHKTDPIRMWLWLDGLSDDVSMSVREATVFTLDHLARAYPDRALALVASILEGIPSERTGAERVEEACVRSLVNFHLWRGTPTATAVIDKITCSLATRHSQAANMLFIMREPLTHGATEAPEENHAVRGRAIRLLSTLVAGACEPLLEMLKRQLGGGRLSPDERVQFEALAKLTSSIATEIYFASGAHQPNNAGPPAIRSQEQERFYREADGVFDKLAAVGLPGLAHHLTETMEMFIPVDPAGVFLRIAAIVRAGRTWDYEYEQLAQDLIVRIVERYLAEYRSLLQQDRGCQTALRETLETFIVAGSARAQMLAYHLDEIFR